jgi:hypothetical protein
MSVRSKEILNSTLMLPILILNHQNVSAKVLVKISKLEGDTWTFTLDNTTKNTYKVFLESSFNDKFGNRVCKETSSDFQLAPGIKIITEKETGNIVSKFYDTNFLSALFNTNIPLVNEHKLSLSVRQKYGPELGFENIEL